MKNIFDRSGNWLHTIFEEQKHDKQKSTIAALDGIRACAILFVISFHIDWINQNYLHLWDWRSNPIASSITIAGGTGVTLFFVLSGFLLFLPYTKALLFAGRWPLARSFYVRRTLRIMPGYYFALLVLIGLTAPEYVQFSGNLGQHIAALFDPSQPLRSPDLSNLGLFLTFLMDASKQTFRQLNGPFWTLAVEWQFYMLLPLLALGVLLLVRRVRIERRLRAVTLCLVGIMVIGLLLRLGGIYFQSNPHATFLVPRSVLNVILFFTYGQTGKYVEDFAVGMLGALIYVYAQNLPSEHRVARGLRSGSLWLWGGGLVILLFSAIWHFQANPPTPAWPFLDATLPYFSWLSEMLLAIGYGMCILGVLFGPTALQKSFSWKPLRWIGLISYSLYIWHLPLLALFVTRVLPLLPPNTNFYLTYTLYWLWAAFVIVPFCVLSYAFIERPGMKLGDRWRKAIEARYSLRTQVIAKAPAEETQVAVSLSEAGKSV